MRRALVAVVVLLVALAVVDRLAVRVADRVAAGRVRTAAGLTAAPSVTITGFPFLTQVLRGRYDRVDVRAHDVRRGSVRLATLTASAYDARLPLSDLLAGRVGAVPVSRVAAQVLLGYGELGRSHGVRASASGSRLRLAGTLSALGLTLHAGALADVTVQGRSVRLVPRSVTVEGRSSSLLDSLVSDFFSFTVAIGRLPYGLALTGVRVEPDGLHVTAAARATVLSGTAALPATVAPAGTAPPGRTAPPAATAPPGRTAPPGSPVAPAGTAPPGASAAGYPSRHAAAARPAPRRGLLPRRQLPVSGLLS